MAEGESSAMPLSVTAPGESTGSSSSSSNCRLLISGGGLAAATYCLAAAVLARPILAEAELLALDESTTSLMALAAGALVGQGAFGELADRRSRLLSLRGTAAFMLVGCTGCALAGGSLQRRLLGPAALRGELALWHVLLGLGLGGEYPAATAFVVEVNSGAPVQGGRGSAHALAVAYLYMASGQLLAAILAVALAVAQSAAQDLAWRLLFLAGALLALASLAMRLRCTAQDATQAASGAAGGLALVCRSSRHLRRTLAGTCVAWLLQSAASCGLTLEAARASFAPHGDSGLAGAETALLVVLMSLPGYSAAFTLARCSRRAIQFVGFGAMAVCFAALAAVIDLPRSQGVQIALYSLLQMVNAGGAGAATRFVPAEVFPACVRASCLGLSAAAGSIGALAASALLPRLCEAAGPQLALVMCALVSGLGVACTALLTPKYNTDVVQKIDRLRPGKGMRECTLEALERGSPYRECPGCGVMVLREGGCNLITCANPNCQDVWCFACGGRGCRTWACASVEAARSPALDILPHLLWPAYVGAHHLEQQRASVPLVEVN